MRTSHIAPLALLLGAVACETPPEPFASDVFWIEVTEAGEPCGPVEITENLTGAEPSPEATAVVETTMSIPGQYMSVTLGENGTAYVNYNGDVLVGMVNENGSVDATFLNEERLEESRVSEDYTHTRVEEEIVEQTLDLVPNNDEENPRFAGTYTLRESFLLEISENDEWDEKIVGTGSTQIPETQDWLIWVDPPAFGGGDTPINQEYNDDCPEEICELRVFSDCTRTFDVSAVRIDGADLDAFEVLEDYDQPAGVN